MFAIFSQCPRYQEAKQFAAFMRRTTDLPCEHLKEQNIELNARVKELTHVVAHQSQQLANKDEQLRLLSVAPTEPESNNTSTYFIILMVIVAIIIGTMIFWMILQI